MKIWMCRLILSLSFSVFGVSTLAANEWAFGIDNNLLLEADRGTYDVSTSEIFNEGHNVWVAYITLSNFEFEVSHTNFGTIEDTLFLVNIGDREIDLEGVNLSVSKRFNIGENEWWSLAPRVGVYVWDADIEDSGVAAGGDNGTNLFAGLTLNWAQNNRWQWRIQYEWYDIPGFDNLSQLQIGAGLHFF